MQGLYKLLECLYVISCGPVHCSHKAYRTGLCDSGRASSVNFALSMVSNGRYASWKHSLLGIVHEGTHANFTPRAASYTMGCPHIYMHAERGRENIYVYICIDKWSATQTYTCTHTNYLLHAQQQLNRGHLSFVRLLCGQPAKREGQRAKLFQHDPQYLKLGPPNRPVTVQFGCPRAVENA